MSESPIKDVSYTAFMVAACRAKETDRADALFRDPLAAKLAGDKGKKIIENLPKTARLGGWTVVIRTCIIDDFIQRALAEGVDTILNLGAGLDTRPYRMEFPPSLRWVEIDYPEVINFKEQQLSDEKPRCCIERVKLDLADLSERRRVLDEVTSQSKKTLVLTEGVILYLTEDAVASLGTDLKNKNSVQYWIAEYVSPSFAKSMRQSGGRTMAKSPFLFDPKDYFALFAGAGWKAKEIVYLTDEAKRRKRPAPLPFIKRVKNFLRSPKRRRELTEQSGFVLFEKG